MLQYIVNQIFISFQKDKSRHRGVQFFFVLLWVSHYFKCGVTKTIVEIYYSTSSWWICYIFTGLTFIACLFRFFLSLVSHYFILGQVDGFAIFLWVSLSLLAYFDFFLSFYGSLIILNVAWQTRLLRLIKHIR